MAGVVPGLVLTALFMAYVVVHALLKPRSRRARRARASVAEFAGALSDLLPFRSCISDCSAPFAAQVCYFAPDGRHAT